MYMLSSNTCDILKSVVVVGCSRVLVFVMWLSSVFMVGPGSWVGNLLVQFSDVFGCSVVCCVLCMSQFS